MSNYRAYLSHAIRGKEGENCAEGTQRKYCDAAIALGNEIRAACPWLDLYIPAEHEDFVQKAYNKKYLDVDQILEIDCDIVKNCGVIVIYVPEGNELQGGRLVEHDFAVNECMPVGLVKDATDAIEFLTERYEYSRHYGGDTWA